MATTGWRRGVGVGVVGVVGAMATGCAGPIGKAALLSIPGSVTLVPGGAGVASKNGSGVLELGLVRGGAHGEVPGEGGPEPLDENVWAIHIRGHGVWTPRAEPGGLSFAVIGHGGMEGGAIGDEPYGRVGADVGPALMIGRRLSIGAEVGYHYGGYMANGHRLPLRLAAIYGGGAFALRAAAWAGAWLGPPDLAGDGPWRTSGWELGLLLGRTTGAMLSVEGYREDDLTVTSVWMSFGIRRATY